MSIYLSDRATDTDSLNFADFHGALKNIIATAQTPVTVGIFGPWGSGKTSLMQMLRQDFEQQQSASVRTVWFTAWKYDRHDASGEPLFLRILSVLYPRESGEGSRESRPILKNPNEKEKKLIQLLEKLEETVYQPISWQVSGERDIQFGQLVTHGGKAVLETVATLGTFGAYSKAKELAGGDGKVTDDIEKAAKAISRQTKSYHRQQLLHLEQFEAMFQEAVDLLPGNPQKRRLIVFIDDLDRCLPEKAIEILEAIKLF